MSKANVNRRVSGWGMIKEQSKLGSSELVWPDGTVVEMPILAITYSDLNEIDEVIEGKMPPVPMLTVKIDGKPKQIEDKDNEVYKKAVDKVQKERSLLIILKSLPAEVQPEGTVEDKMAALEKDLLAGHVIRLVRDIMTISNLNLDDAVNEAKND